MTAVTDTLVKGSNIGSLQFGDEVNRIKTLVIETANTVDASDTIALTLATYGITTVLGVYGYKHTTDNSVIVTENPTTAVSAGVLTLTVPVGTDDDKRIYQIYYL
jgi:hypothetical protein